MRRKKRNKQKKIVALTTALTLLTLTTGYAAFNTNISIKAKGNIKWNEECTINNEWTYDYKENTIYNFTAPCTATYKLETWGAQGGNSLTLEGGYGGYTVGKIELKRNHQLYIVVGGMGKSTGILQRQAADYGNYLTGGYNGGGAGENGFCNKASFRHAASGGGATHIALSSGLLYTFKNKQEEIIIVSGGGGGAYSSSSDGKTILVNSPNGVGGSAGGYIGNSAPWNGTSSTSIAIIATGGTQERGGHYGSSYTEKAEAEYGEFGKAKDSNKGSGCNNFSGAGSGFYGGGQGFYTPGAGGSSYINNPNLKEKHMTCYNCTTNDKEGTKTITTTKVSETPLSENTKKGNGYAKITLISNKTN